MATMTKDLNAIWREFHQRLHDFIARRVKSSMEADDIFQDVFMRIHQHLTTVQDSERLGSWIFQITRHAIIDHYRKGYRQHELMTDDELEALAVDEEDPMAFNQKMAACLRPLLERLPESYREALQLVELDGLTQQAAARRLGLSVSGMKSRVRRGRHKLKELLQTCCQIEMDSVGNIIEYEMKDLPMCRSCGLAR